MSYTAEEQKFFYDEVQAAIDGLDRIIKVAENRLDADEWSDDHRQGLKKFIKKSTKLTLMLRDLPINYRM